MRTFKTIYLCIVIPLLAFFIVQELSEKYLKSLKATGGIIEADRIIGIQVLPYILSIASLIIIVTIRLKP